MTLKVSTAAEIGPLEKVTEVVELPFPQGGRKPVIRVRALNASEFTLAGQAAPTMGDSGGAPNPQAGIELLRTIASIGIVEPEFSFGPARETGKVWWDDLVAGNQHAAIRAIYRVSGVGESPDAEVARELATFPDERAGRGNSSPPSPPVRTRAKAAR